MTNQIIRHIDGHALCECEAESLRGAVEQAVREEVRRGWITTNSTARPSLAGGWPTAAYHDNADGPCCCGAWHVNESTPDHRNVLIF